MSKPKTTKTLQTAKASLTNTPSGILQRKCATCGNHTVAGGKCDECRKNSLLRRKSSDNFESSKVPPIVNEVLRSAGRPLDAATRGFMESRLGYDLSRVRVHTDSKASESARTINALAYTVGRDVVFGAGQYVPNTSAGRGLLAHELTHVIQAGDNFSGSAIEMGRDDSVEERTAEYNETMMRSIAGNSAANLLHRKKGGSIGGFFANIGRAITDLFTGDEPDYDKKTLQDYLKYLKDNNDIEDDFDSDNKARGVVKQKFYVGESTAVKILLVREMLSGAAFDDDEQAIIQLLLGVSEEERVRIADTITYAKLHDKFDGAELDQLYALLPKMELFHPRAKKEHKNHTLEEYIKQWEITQGSPMTDSERKVLARGCVGISSLNLHIIPNPDLSQCYGSFEAAWNAAHKMNEFLSKEFPKKKAVIFSKRLWAGDNDYTPDPRTGRVDMSKDKSVPRPGGFTNFDYGFYDEATGKWWHANHCEPTILGANCRAGGPMEVYESNLPYYSRPLQDFDTQVFCVGVPTVK